MNSQISAMRQAIPVNQDRLWISFGLISVFSLLFFLSFDSKAPGTFLLFSFLLAELGIAFCIFHAPRETLHPGKLISLMYIACFSLTPVWLADKRVLNNPYYGPQINELMDRTAIICFMGYLCFLAGYWLLHKRFGSHSRRQTLDYSTRSRAEVTAYALAVVSCIFYALLLAQVGGLAFLLNYAEGRADLFEGAYGGLFWGVHLFFAAYGFFLVAKIKRHPIWCLMVGLAISLAFVPFHGRDLIVAPIISWMLAYHSLHKRISWKAVGLGFCLLIAISGLVAAFRSGGNQLASKDPLAFLSQFKERFDLYFSAVISANIEQFDSAMIAVRFVAKENHTLGPFVFTNWIEPLDRAFFGGVVPSIYSGVFLDRLIMPEHRGWHTAISPSIIGELWLGLGWTGVVFGMFALGSVASILSRWMYTFMRNPLLFAAYPFTVYMVTKLVVDGSTHLFRPLVVFAVVYVISLLLPARKMPVQS